MSAGTGLRVWRFLYYLDPRIDGDISVVSTTMLSTAGNSIGTSIVPTMGWNEVVIDLDNPSVVLGSFDDLNLTTITIQMFMVAPGVFTESITIKRIFQYPRDRGTSGISLGF